MADLRLGFVAGTTPDKWARRWESQGRGRLDLVPISESEQERSVREHEVDACLARLPVADPVLHVVRLYSESAMVVAARDHFIAAADDRVELEDLSDEQLVRPHASGWVPDAAQLDWPTMTEREAIETVAAGTGIVLVPGPVARLYARKDVVAKPVGDLPETEIGLIWLKERDAEDVQALVGVLRGRSGRSSRD